MRKSIYYLIANILSTIAAAIFIGVVNFQYPFFGTDLIVTGMSQNCWEPLKIVLPVVALSIIYVTRDVVVHKDGKQDTGLDKTINVIMGIITILSILYTWFAAILEYDQYAINVKINFPIIYFIYFAVALVVLFVAPVISKKNQTIGSVLTFSSILIAVGGVINECLEYWYTTVSVVGVIVLLILVSLFSLKKSAK